MADVESRPAVAEGGSATLAGPKKIAVMVAAGCVFGFGMAYVVGMILNAEGWRLLALSSVGLCVGGLVGAVVSRLMDHAKV